jgi:hypothetical protein
MHLYHLQVWSLLALICTTVSCTAHDAAPIPIKASVWRSEHHPVTIEFSHPWGLTDSPLDSEKRVVVGLLDSTDGSSYVVKIGEDASSELVSDDVLHAAIKEQMSAAQAELVHESTADQHDASFHHFRWTMFNEKFQKRMCVDAFSRRTGAWSITIQWAFPCEETVTATSRVPAKITDLDRSATIFQDLDKL